MFKVYAINKNCDEIQKWFETEKEANEYAKLCETNDCCCIHVADMTNKMNKTY